MPEPRLTPCCGIMPAQAMTCTIVVIDLNKLSSGRIVEEIGIGKVSKDFHLRMIPRAIDRGGNKTAVIIAATGGIGGAARLVGIERCAA